MSAQWTTSQIVGTVASAMALGAVCGVAFQAPAQTELYAPAATVVRTAIPAAPVTRMAAANQYVAEQTYEIPQEAQFAEFAEAEPVFVQAPAQGISWIGGAAAAVWGAAGAVMWQSRKNAQKVEADFYDQEVWASPTRVAVATLHALYRVFVCPAFCSGVRGSHPADTDCICPVCLVPVPAEVSLILFFSGPWHARQGRRRCHWCLRRFPRYGRRNADQQHGPHRRRSVHRVAHLVLDHFVRHHPCHWQLVWWLQPGVLR